MKNVRIYQLPVEHAAKFMRLEFVKEHDIMPKLEDYKIVYEGNEDDEVELDDIFMKFNTSHPEGFKGHSLSISDIVALDEKYYYCDSMGWEEVTDLFPMPDLKKGEKYYCINDYIMDDGTVAYEKGKTYEMLSDVHLGIDESGSELHNMSEVRDFFLYFDLVL